MRVNILGAMFLLITADCGAALAGPPLKSAPVINQPPPLSGHWYMGTATGFDCNLVILPNHTLTVQYGGCFSQGPLMKSAWSQTSDRVTLSDPALEKKLGAYLSILYYKNYMLIVPKSEKSYVAAHGYNKAHCFWPSVLSGGFQWPKEVNDFDTGWPKKKT